MSVTGQMLEEMVYPEAFEALKAERDTLRAALKRAEEERDRLHASLKTVADLCIDRAGMRVMEVVGENSPPRAVAKIITERDAAIRERDEWKERTENIATQRDAAIARAERAESSEHLVAVNVRANAERDAAFAIAAWLEREMGNGGWRIKALAADIRAGAWKKETP